MKVYLLEGWFGDVEWLEGIYAKEEEAKAECERLWKTRTSEKAPDYVNGLCKFAVAEWEVL